MAKKLAKSNFSQVEHHTVPNFAWLDLHKILD
jgi:hypothetical protein